MSVASVFLCAALAGVLLAQLLALRLPQGSSRASARMRRSSGTALPVLCAVGLPAVLAWGPLVVTVALPGCALLDEPPLEALLAVALGAAVLTIAGVRLCTRDPSARREASGLALVVVLAVSLPCSRGTLAALDALQRSSTPPALVPVVFEGFETLRPRRATPVVLARVRDAGSGRTWRIPLSAQREAELVRQGATTRSGWMLQVSEGWLGFRHVCDIRPG